MKKIVLFGFFLGLAGCTNNPSAQQQIVQTGQLICTADNMYAALSNPIAVPITVQDQTAAFVAAACKIWNASAIPVAPPPDAVVQAATIVVPAGGK